MLSPKVLASPTYATAKLITGRFRQENCDRAAGILPRSSSNRSGLRIERAHSMQRRRATMRESQVRCGKMAATALLVGFFGLASVGPSRAGILSWWFQQKQNAINGVTGQRAPQIYQPSPADMRRARNQMLRQLPAP